MSTATASARLPIVSWEKPSSGGFTYPIQRMIAATLFAIICTFRAWNLDGGIRPDDLASAPEYLLEVGFEFLTDPLVWVLSIWLLFAGDKAEPKVPQGAFDCPHCGERLVATEEFQKSPLGTVSRCNECRNSFEKQSAPPQL